MLYYEKLSDYHELNGIQQGFIYESVAKIHQNMGNFVEYSKFIKMAYTEYAKAGNQRKMSDLANACRRISKKKNWKEDINHAE